MSCKKVFWENPYLTELSTTITSVMGDTITVSETIFYAFSGGQQSDSGTIGTYEVIEASKVGKEIYYKLIPEHRLRSGESVHMIIDWEKRYRLMRLHFAAELVLEWVYQNYGHPEKVGANISEDKARVDFKWDGNINLIFPALEAALKRLIHENHEITSAFSDPESEQRYWKILGFSQVPCGGTHIKATGEIGDVKLSRRNIGGGKERIEITLK
ncbi:MAG: alanyl-tRNA editing protein [Clostridiales bacterium 38-18]|nr:MAG: alanyl-tRNA editing protein [Clostridiales bacterium 38-18]